jgi:hypothetical protein
MFDWDFAQITRSFLDRTGEGWIRLVEFEVNLTALEGYHGVATTQTGNDLYLRMTMTYIYQPCELLRLLYIIFETTSTFSRIHETMKRTIDSHSVLLGQLNEFNVGIMVALLIVWFEKF